ncbi:MAG: sigma-70 family RNA polymerase sigma factor [Bacteroidaceae bacterium]|nr:sigma-70 family RNA polymerase sigma factor [Bacteroidaceae bacterium]
MFNVQLIFKPLGSLSDDELMQRVGSKDDDRAFGELYHRHSRRLMGFFFRQVERDEALAADLVQDAFVRVWTARDKFTDTSFRTWLFTIAFNLLKNHYRHAEHQKQFELFVAQHQTVIEDSKIIETLDDKAFDLALRQELERMSPDGRLLFSLRFEEELSVPQIAEVMAIPEGTVKSRLHTLTQTLKKKLNPS